MYFKDPDNKLYFDPSQAVIEKHILTEISEDEFHAVITTMNTPTPEQLAVAARAERDRLIESVRWRIERYRDELALGSDPTESLEPLLQYTQALRDVPQQTGFPTDIIWPEAPSNTH